MLTQKKLLGNLANYRQYVSELVNSERGDKVLKNFLLQWFVLEGVEKIEKNPDLYPDFDKSLAESMSKEISVYLDDAIAQDSLTLKHILTSKNTTVDQTLASFYGLSSAGKVEMAKGRQGLLTTAGFLAVNANTDATIPTTRGSFILSTLLCVDVPGVPSGVQLPDTGSDEPQTTRMKFEK